MSNNPQIRNMSPKESTTDGHTGHTAPQAHRHMDRRSAENAFAAQRGTAQRSACYAICGVLATSVAAPTRLLFCMTTICYRIFVHRSYFGSRYPSG